VDDAVDEDARQVHCTSSGSMRPLSTSLSHSAIVSFAAVAITGLKFRPVRQKRRFPKRSDTAARTSATSPGSARSRM
jgi:hypothetical protein